MRDEVKPCFRSWPVWSLRVFLIVFMPLHLAVGIYRGIKEGFDSWITEWRYLDSL